MLEAWIEPSIQANPAAVTARDSVMACDPVLSSPGDLTIGESRLSLVALRDEAPAGRRGNVAAWWAGAAAGRVCLESGSRGLVPPYGIEENGRVG